MVYRVYVEKKESEASEARALLSEVKAFLGIGTLEKVRILNRYDVEDVDPEMFETFIGNVFSEPQVDLVYRELSEASLGEAKVFAVEALPGQFDQRADSAAQCIQIISQKERPLVADAQVYALEGELSEEDVAAIKKHVINPVETREASMEMPETLKVIYDAPPDVAVLEGFNALEADGLQAMVDDLETRGVVHMDGPDACAEGGYLLAPELGNEPVPLLRRLAVRLCKRLIGAEERIDTATVDAVLAAFAGGRPASGYRANIQGNLEVSANKQGVRIEPISAYRSRVGRI